LLDAIFNTSRISGVTTPVFRFAFNSRESASYKYISFLKIIANTPKFTRYWVRFINYDQHNATTIYSMPRIGGTGYRT
jgi:hypothetical protein